MCRGCEDFFGTAKLFPPADKGRVQNPLNCYKWKPPGPENLLVHLRVQQFGFSRKMPNGFGSKANESPQRFSTKISQKIRSPQQEG